MKVRALTSFCIGNGTDVHTGDQFDLPEHAAKLNIRRGWVEAAEEKPQPKPKPDGKPRHPDAQSGPKEPTTRDPAPETR